MTGSMISRILLLILATASMAIVLPPAQAEPEQSALESEKCAPPCGYIYPVIGVHSDLTADQLKTSNLGDFPKTQKIRLTYAWDMDQEGTGAPGDHEEMTITTVISKKPVWMKRASIEPSSCSFRLNPIVNEYAPEQCVLDLTVEFDPDYVPIVETDLDHYGKRLMLFATSRESGTFKPGYGVEDMRWKFDGAPDLSVFGEPSAPRGQPDVAESPLPVLAPLAFVGVAAAVLLRRRS